MDAVEPKDRIILHCDLNCFYASVELLSHPDLRDVPTAVCGDPDKGAAYIAEHLSTGAGVICFDEYADRFAGHIVHRIGAADDLGAQARHIFDALRAFDETDVTEIWAQCPDDAGLGLAVANRLKKAAGFHVINV